MGPSENVKCILLPSSTPEGLKYLSRKDLQLHTHICILEEMDVMDVLWKFIALREY